ncbi:PREDICTED: chymotrypsin-2-like isoform X2 [Ceratosolen solmsi marchali]|uniref:Chymotrypsin-2-like isoform X2 n=2 Tax=Ceratosolen solmsi marchali TaxID=326594 RepID=A0AAJ6YVU3_9HYME|nr:PREDICTED: chymotrypsin-2-like isoform X2 [Ceratosolen solmsi marchali]XP_011505262.1 PREDICTED: chymotrypsin-2-like isoform X2 [Ceratosolen solmsi marchali]
MIWSMRASIKLKTTMAKNVRIIGGEDADITEFPYMASFRIYKDELLICGGAIISHQHILTAAHCFENRRKSDIRVYLGTTNSRNYSIPYYKIRNVAAHPNYLKIDKKSRWTVLNDIAIVTIEPNIEFNAFQNKIDLPTKEIKVGETAIMTGWGWRTYPKGTTSNTLQKISMKVIPNCEYDRDYPHMVNDDHLCAFTEEKAGICMGDSGGPLVSHGKVIGICSFGRLCALGDPDVYAKVYSYLDFIKSCMNSVSDSNSTCCCLIL